VTGYHPHTEVGAWIDQGACRGMDPDLFFPIRGGMDLIAEAREICAICPVHAECFTYAMDRGRELLGIWAGTSSRWRVKNQKAWKRSKESGCPLSPPHMTTPWRLPEDVPGPLVSVSSSGPPSPPSGTGSADDR
jgi:WhiB family redox-sensing transcriptional regulator